MFFYFSLPLLSCIAFFVASTEFLFFLKIAGFFESVILLKNAFVFNHFLFFHIISKQYEASFHPTKIFSTQERDHKLFSRPFMSFIRDRERRRKCLTIFKNICLDIAFYNKTTGSLNIF